MNKYGITNVKVKRVVRIHNRFLRNKFEDHSEAILDTSNSSYKKSLEYLFYGVDPKNPSEMFHIIQEGFRPENVQIIHIKF